jgi:hypothetical protein
MQAKLATTVRDFGRLLQQAGPYVVLEIVLPGGTLFALLLYLYRSGQLRQLTDLRGMARAVLRAANRAFDQLAFTMQPLGALPAGGGRPTRDGLEPLGLVR